MKAEGDYAEANQLMGLINSGTGAIGNIFNPLKGAADILRNRRNDTFNQQQKQNEGSFNVDKYLNRKK